MTPTDKSYHLGKFSDSEVKKLGLDQNNDNLDIVGGMYWQDCMRWTVVAVNPEDVPADSGPEEILPSSVGGSVVVPSLSSIISLVSN